MKLNNLKYISIIIIVFLTGSLAFAQKASKTAYKVRAKGRQLVITYQGKAHTLNTTEQVDAAKVTETKILFASRKGDFMYLVIDVMGQSREKLNDRQCGAGEEGNFLWVKLDSGWRIAGIKSIAYESCWTSTSSDNYKINASTMSIEISDFSRDIESKVSYNAGEPEKGFKIEEKAISKK